MPGLNTNQNAMPGVGSASVSDTRVVVKAGAEYLAGGGVIRGADSRDTGNTGDLDYLRAGLLMGINSSTNKWAPSILGVTTVAYDNSASINTTLTVSAATATEINRRIGSSGTLTCIGPPSSAGTVASTTVTYSAVNTTTGVITVTALGADKISGSFIADTDGTQTPLAVIGNGGPLKVTDQDDSSIDIQSGRLVIGGTLDSSQIINWPTDTSLITWVKDAMNGSAGSRFVFDDAYI